MPNLKQSRGLVLDPSLYALGDDERDFLKQLTGIEDDGDLKEHILAVQRDAFAVRITNINDRQKIPSYFSRSTPIHASGDSAS